MRESAEGILSLGGVKLAKVKARTVPPAEWQGQMREVIREACLMNSWQQWKQLELYSQYPSQTASRDTSSEEFIASRLSESPIPPIGGTHGVNL